MAQQQTYTVRIEWPVTYYCDTTVEASSPEEAAAIAMEDPDYDNQSSYDDSGDSTVEGVCIGDEYDYCQRIEVPEAGSESVEITREEAAALLSGISVALDANGGDCPDSVREALAAAVEKLNLAFDFGL